MLDVKPDDFWWDSGHVSERRRWDSHCLMASGRIEKGIVVYVLLLTLVEWLAWFLSRIQPDLLLSLHYCFHLFIFYHHPSNNSNAPFPLFIDHLTALSQILAPRATRTETVIYFISGQVIHKSRLPPITRRVAFEVGILL